MTPSDDRHPTHVSAGGRASAWPALSLLAVGLVALVVAGACGAIAVWLGVKGDGQWVDAVPSQVADRSRTGSGEVVWLRGRRDRDHMITLRDGRRLYPTREDPHVMVDCGAGTCAGYLRGAVYDLTVDGPLPTGWPAGVGPQVRVVVVDDPGTAARENAQRAARWGLGAVVLGIGACAGALATFLRRDRRAVP